MPARFRETIPTIKSVLSSEIQSINFGFLTEITILPFFFPEIGIFSNLTVLVSLLAMGQGHPFKPNIRTVLLRLNSITGLLTSWVGGGVGVRIKMEEVVV